MQAALKDSNLPLMNHGSITPEMLAALEMGLELGGHEYAAAAEDLSVGSRHSPDPGPGPGDPPSHHDELSAATHHLNHSFSRYVLTDKYDSVPKHGRYPSTENTHLKL